MKEINIKESIKMIFISLFITYTLYEKFMLPELQIPMITSLLFIIAFFIIGEVKKRTEKFRIHSCITYIIFAIFMVVGDSFKEYGSFHGIIGNPFRNTDILEGLFEEFAHLFNLLNGNIGNIIMLISAICKGIGYYFIIGYSIEWLKSLYKNIDKFKSIFKNYDKVTNKIFTGNVFLKVFIILIIAWLPYLIIKFPGSVSTDASMQINQFLGNSKMTTHHPLFSTVLIGNCIKLGLFLGSESFGILLYVIFQYLIMAGTFSYCISSVNNKKCGGMYSWILLIFYAFSPVFPSYATLVVKDTFYSCIFVLYTMFLIKIILDLNHEKIEKRNIIICDILSFILMISRNNGVYSVIPTLIALIIACLIKVRKKIVILLVIPIVLYNAYNIFQYDILNIEKGSIKEALSIPFQQTARYVKTYPNEVTDYEKEVIDKVLDYEKLAEIYNPTVSDPVKATYKGDDEALKEYFKVWFKQLKKHPITYVEATVNSSYYAFYPDEPNIRAYGIVNMDSSFGGIFSLLSILLMGFVMGLSLVPIISLAINPVIYVWLLIYMVIRSIYKKQFLNLVVFIPMLVQVLVIIAGPAVFNHPRYIYPIYWSILITIPFISKQEDEIRSLPSAIRQ